MKFLAVCGFGVGSSMLLKLNISNAMNELGISGDVENTDLTSAVSTECDAIFTSEELSSELKQRADVPVISIRHFVDKSEIKKALQEFIENK